MEVMNSSFGCAIVPAKTPDDLKFLAGKRIVPFKVYVVDGNEKPSDDLVVACAKNSFRYNFGISGTNLL
jgi:hypothetical protein